MLPLFNFCIKVFARIDALVVIDSSSSSSNVSSNISISSIITLALKSLNIWSSIILTTPGFIKFEYPLK